MGSATAAAGILRLEEIRNMGRLQGKVAFITGSGSGIARAAARLFALEGASVAIAELKPELGRSCEATVRDSGGDATFVETDVTKEESVKGAIEQTVRRFGKLDILYNCAGGSIVQDAPVTEVDMFVWQHTMSLDLLGTFHCCRHGIPQLTKSGGGAIVNLSSVAALRGFPGHVYAAAKGGIISFTRALAGQYAKNGIRANAICPGLVKTDRVLQRFGNPDDPNSGTPQAQAMKGQFRRYPFSVGEPEDIARIALFLASDEARMITGAIIPADGGLSAY
jgi:NAD(P)-dependent dehydrogenase (short-subunit alcohol dehydrogenase family)